ncbi:hypothetical protein VCHENC02_5458A, partial [Vibrio harveyi]
MIIYLE